MVVRQAESPHSYIVRGPSGCEYRRNRKHLRKVAESAPIPIDIDDTDEDSLTQSVSGGYSSDSPMATTNRTSSGRTIRAPVRYQDYVRF